ncbi:MAG TPA: hypothetical protein VJU18_16055 [Vicinamibacteria bacterium]|nr:hypothetical protein [Vicinamibacteria bacterium]
MMAFGLAAPVAVIWVLATAGRSPHKALGAAALAATIGVLYAPALGYGFILDDFFFARPLTLRQLLSTFWGNWDPLGLGNGQYRPILALVLALDYEIWGPRTWGYHLTNLVILFVNGLLASELLRRLTGSARAGLAGALAWVAHPLSTSVAGWCAERTDSVMAAFYLAALLALTSVPWSRRALVLTLTLGALSLGSKEMAATLPATAAAVLVFGTLDRRGRWTAVASLGVLTAVYIAWWIHLLPTKASLKLEGAIQQVPHLLLPIFFPSSYERWWHAEPASWLLLGPLVLAMVGTWLLLRRHHDPRPARSFALAAAWPILTIGPIFGLRPPDVYRLGFLIAFAFALALAAMVAALEARRFAPVILMGALALGFAPLARDSVAVWGPGGFQYSQIIRWNLMNPDWDQQLSPEMRRVFKKQMRKHPP